jgi:predicted phosphoadenosine phosphosulfate sulfurtransferase
MVKRYLEENVYVAACQRREYIFKNFEKIYVSFSGGKDSGILLNLVIDYMRKNNIKEKVGVLFIDLEGQYQCTIDYIKMVLDENADLFDPYWCCMPINLRNAVSVFEPFWTCWDFTQRDKWIRNYPDFDCITEYKHPFPFFQKHMEFEHFVPEFGKWYSENGKRKTACLVGIRSDESLNRFRTIATKQKDSLNNLNWTTRVEGELFNCYPIFDWNIEDVWVANAKFGWEYNRLYDMFYKAGVPLGAQRICQPYGDDQRIGLNLFKIVEPDSWARVVNRVSGANFGNIYAGERILGYRRVDLPEGHTWKSYTKLLLASLPEELASHYKKKFIKFMRYWHRKGCPIDPKYHKDLPQEAKLHNKFSTRGAKDKCLITYRRIPDYLDNKIEQKRLAPTWRRMAICILKNDQICKSLSFGQSKKQRERMKVLLEKYRRI